jgi:hypothetical protein
MPHNDSKRCYKLGSVGWISSAFAAYAVIVSSILLPVNAVKAEGGEAVYFWCTAYNLSNHKIFNSRVFPGPLGKLQDVIGAWQDKAYSTLNVDPDSIHCSFSPQSRSINDAVWERNNFLDNLKINDQQASIVPVEWVYHF